MPPRFRLGQRVYSRANPIHGKVVESFRLEGEVEHTYTIELDKPNRLGVDRLTIAESGLRATLEEALEWQAEEKRKLQWLCPGCGRVNAGGDLICVSCGFPTKRNKK